MIDPDRESHWIRLGGLGALLALSVLFVHVPASMWASNAAEFSTGLLALLALGLFAVVIGLTLMTGLLWLLPRPLRPLLAGSFCAFGLLWWIYAYFVVGRMVMLNGQQAPMDFNTRLGVWELLVVAVAGTIIAGWAIWRPRLATFVVGFLNIGLLFATIAACVTTPAAPSRRAADSDTSHVLRFSSRENVLVILLDGLQSDFTDQVFQQDAALREGFDGFEFYKNAVSSAPTTFLSLPAIHSGDVYDGHGSIGDYFTESIAHRSFLNRFTAAGYDSTVVNPVVDLCPQQITSCLDASRLLRSASSQLMHDGLRLLDLALFRVSPIWVKRLVYAQGNWLAVRLVDYPFEVDRVIEGHAFLEAFSQRFVVSDGPPTIKFLHLFSTHPPFVLDDDCRVVSTEHAAERHAPQAHCALRAVRGLLDRLKQAGIYDQTLMLVLADHGMGLPSQYVDPRHISPEDWTTLAGAANPTFLLKPRGQRGPLRDTPANVQLVDVGATLCALSGACTTSTGIAAGHAPADRPRRFNFYSWKHEYWEAREIPTVIGYEIAGPPWQQASWSKSDEPTYRLGDVMTFGPAGSGEPYLLFGWTAPAEWGRWTSSGMAQLAMRLAEPVGQPLDLTARVSPFVPPYASQTVTWTANDQEIGTWTFTNPEPSIRHLTIPASVLANGRDLRLAVHVASPTAPRDLGLSGDPRHLGLGLRELTIAASPDVRNVPPAR